MRAPFFSIVTITKDNLSGLKETALSVSAQHSAEWSDYEWIVIDGNSQDHTEEFLKTTNAHWYNSPDDGLYDAMNKGLAHCNGIFVIFMNAGDIFAAPDTLRTIQNKLSDDLPNFIYGDALEENKNGDPYYKKSKPHTQMHKGMITHHQSMFYKRACLKKLRFDLDYNLAADYDFTWRFMKDNPKALYIDTPICLFETGGVSQRNAKKARREEYAIRRRHGVSYLQCLKTYARQSVAHTLRRLAPVLYWKVKP